MMPSRQDLELLTRRPAVFHILLALTAGERHGLGIADEVDRESRGTLEVGPGTLYRSLAELVEAGLIKWVRARAADADPRRKYYRLTPAGRVVLAAEARRLEHLVNAARARRVLRVLP
jgi:DNA-binding PadR family transcriptional regulator